MDPLKANAARKSSDSVRIDQSIAWDIAAVKDERVLDADYVHFIQNKTQNKTGRPRLKRGRSVLF